MGACIAALCCGALVVRTTLANRMEERFPDTGELSGEEDPEVLPPSVQPDLVDSVRLQCTRAAKAFGLSDREEEILEFLVRGRSAKSIAAEKCISYNTVKTHMSHIYLKVDVHTREELIQAVETIQHDE